MSAKFKNYILTKLSLLRSPNHSKRDFLIVSTTALGDTLWSTAAIRELKNSFPDQKIYVLTSKLGSAILKNNPHIEEVFIWKGLRFFSLLSALAKKKIGTAIIFHISQRMILPFCSLAGIGIRVGTNRQQKGLDGLLTASCEPQYEHEIQRRLKLVALVGGKIENRSMEVFPGEAEEKELKRWKESHPLAPNLRLIGIHPGAMQEFRRTPKETWITVLNDLRKEGPFHFFITGTRSEQAMVHEIQKNVDGSSAMIEELSLLALSLFMRDLDLFISNDTGPLHLALTQKIPTLSLYVPTDPNLCGPFAQPKAVVISRSKTCSPCLMKKCQRAFCFYQIAPKELFDQAMEILKK